MPDFTILDYALALRALDLSIIPVCEKGKLPTEAWKRWQSERADEHRIREWFPDGRLNVGIVTGAISGIVVIDTDSPEAEEWALKRLPFTPWKVRTSKGWHRYYRHPGTPVRNGARLDTGSGRIALDVRGDGGFVVGPGSTHASGHVYNAVGNWSIPSAKLPAFWPGLLERPRLHQSTRSPVVRPIGGADAVMRARAYLTAVPVPVVGQGSDAATFYAAARLVKGFAIAPEIAVNLLVEWSGFDRWWVEKKVSSACKFATEPEGALLGVARS